MPRAERTGVPAVLVRWEKRVEAAADRAPLTHRLGIGELHAHPRAGGRVITTPT